MAKEKKDPRFNEHGELIEVTEEQKAYGITYGDGRRLMHGLNSDQSSEMNDLGMGLEAYKKLKGISDKPKKK